jgi:hypothetical protein
MPETRFDDIMTLEIDSGFDRVMLFDLDDEYIHVCEENSIQVVSYTCDKPSLCGVSIVRDGCDPYLRVEVSESSPMPNKIVVKLSGIRDGKAESRFDKFTEEQATRNNNFWNSWNQ